MAVTVKIPTQLRAATDGEATAKVSGSTVGEVLDALYERYGELRHRIAEDGGLRRFVNVYVGGEDIRFLDGLETPVDRRRRGDDPAGGRRRLIAARFTDSAPLSTRIRASGALSAAYCRSLASAVVARSPPHRGGPAVAGARRRSRRRRPRSRRYRRGS